MLGIFVCVALGLILGKADKTVDFRLPNSIIPKHYSLEIQPYLNNLTFEGKVEIIVTCINETNKVILHSKELTIKKEHARVFNKEGLADIVVQEIEYDVNNNFLILHLAKSLEYVKEYAIFLSFNGKILKKNVGFHVTKYPVSKYKVHYVLSTQFQAIHARRAFPCFDEPALKATFDVTLVRWRNMSSLSNMPRIKTQPRGKDWVADTFLTTFKMSTYNLAYYFGEYVGKIKNKIAVWAPEEKSNQVDLSLRLGNMLLHFFEDRLKIPYVLPKLDMVPVTSFPRYAMENWGLLIYKNTTLLYDTKLKDFGMMKKIFDNVAHEIAHQWFGNLVTPKWWSDIWLSEGLSMYMVHIAIKHFFPFSNEIDSVLSLSQTLMYSQDCVRYSTTVWKEIGANEINDHKIFENNMYFKGAMIIRMAQEILRNETFWKGITAQPGEKKIDMKERMWSWTHLSGAPIITVERDYDTKTASFMQKSCKIWQPENHESDLWQIPISYVTPKRAECHSGIQTWLTEREIKMENMPNDDEWILVNGYIIGYYLVNYDARNWELLAKQLRNNHEVFLPEQRYKILADANMLYMLQNVKIDVVLDVSSYLGKENDLSIFSDPNMKFIEEIRSEIEYSSYYKYWREYIMSILAPIPEILGWDINYEMETYEIRELHIKAIRILCEVDYPPCLKEAEKRIVHFLMTGYFKGWEMESKPEQLLCTAVRSGSNKITEYVLQQFEKNNNTTLLSCSKNETFIKITLDTLEQGWDTNFDLAVPHLMQNKVYWQTFLNFLNNFLQKQKKVAGRLLMVSNYVSSVEQKQKLREIFRNHSHKISKEFRDLPKILKRNKSENEIEERVKAFGTWLERRVELK